MVNFLMRGKTFENRNIKLFQTAKKKSKIKFQELIPKLKKIIKPSFKKKIIENDFEKKLKKNKFYSFEKNQKKDYIIKKRSLIINFQKTLKKKFFLNTILLNKSKNRKNKKNKKKTFIKQNTELINNKKNYSKIRYFKLLTDYDNFLINSDLNKEKKKKTRKTTII